MIKKLFKQFNFNKIQNKQKGEVIKSQAFIKDECSFKPKVSVHSNQLAEKVREKSIKGNYRFYEVMTSKIKESNKWKMHQKQMIDEKNMKECTFTPEINTRSHNILDSASHRKNQKSMLHEKSVDKCSRNHPHDHKHTTD